MYILYIYIYILNLDQQNNDIHLRTHCGPDETGPGGFFLLHYKHIVQYLWRCSVGISLYIYPHIYHNISGFCRKGGAFKRRKHTSFTHSLKPLLY